MVAFRRDGGEAPPGPGRTSKAKSPPPSVEARVAAAALRLQRAGELDAVEALLRLVAGDVAPGAKPKKPPRQIRNTPWRDEAKRLRVEGLDLEAIAAKLGRPPALVRRLLGEHDASFRSGHEIRAVLPPQEVKMAAIRSFATGDITADELRRILRTYESQPAGGNPT
jgi:hypothetical protein